MYKGEVVSIHIASAEGEPTVSVDQVEAVIGKGLIGDRYYNPQTAQGVAEPGREITLIEIEAIEALQREEGLKISPGESRRNIVTRGVPLNHLVGREFRVGEARLKGVRLCEPCKYLASKTSPQVLPGLIHRGGLRANILSGGIIRPGDPIEE